MEKIIYIVYCSYSSHPSRDWIHSVHFDESVAECVAKSLNDNPPYDEWNEAKVLPFENGVFHDVWGNIYNKI